MPKADIIAHEEPCSPVSTQRMATDQWRHFDKLRRHPAGFVAIGDSICSFNPAYGQAMISAAQQAVALGRCLGHLEVDSPRLAQRVLPGRGQGRRPPMGHRRGRGLLLRRDYGAKPPMVDRLNRYLSRR